MAENKTPFLGVFTTQEGELIDVASGETISANQIKPPMSPFYGRFYDKDGVEHDLRDYMGGGEGGGGLGQKIDTIQNELEELRESVGSDRLDGGSF